MNISIKEKAKYLRKKGYSLSEISSKTGLSKSTIQSWVKDIKLTKIQRSRLESKAERCGKNGLVKAQAVNKRKIEEWKNKISNRADKFKSILDVKSEAAKLLCGVLYLCEGAKYPATKHLVFGNSDPRMIKTFLALLRKNFDIDEKKFRCRIMHRHDQDGKTLNRYWSTLTRIPTKQFYNSYFDKRTKGKKTKFKDYKGICALMYLSVDLQYEIQMIGEAVYSFID